LGWWCIGGYALRERHRKRLVCVARNVPFGSEVLAQQLGDIGDSIPQLASDKVQLIFCKRSPETITNLFRDTASAAQFFKNLWFKPQSSLDQCISAVVVSHHDMFFLFDKYEQYASHFCMKWQGRQAMKSTKTNPHEHDQPEPERRTISVEEAGRILGVSRGAAYAYAKEGSLPTIRLGKRLLVPKSALDKMLQID
jgi:excisionase family DNA binding protein